jgi:hypothetical protein
MIDKDLKIMLKNPWVQCPQIPEVQSLLSNIKIKNMRRGDKKARERLDYLENIYRKWINDIVDTSEFPYFYFVNGVTDAINQWIATETRSWQYFEGDYEYANMISNNGIKVKELDPAHVLYISNPACATGNFIDIEDIDVPVILDCAYVGTVEKKKINLPKNTEQIWFSFSKGWGLIGQRLGVVFTKTPHKSLDIMKNVEAWNYTGVELAIKVIENFEIDTTWKVYRNKQLEICKNYNFQPADCFFIANSTDLVYAVRRRVDNVARLDLSRLIEV